jgi:hypothetical protein
MHRLSRRDIHQLHSLGAMRDKGILTADEFAKQKSLLLNVDANTRPRAVRMPRRLAVWTAGVAAGLLALTALISMPSGKSAARETGGPAAASQR